MANCGKGRENLHLEKKELKFVFIFYLNDKSGFKLDKKILFYVSYHNSLRLSIISLCDCSDIECTYIHTDVAPYNLSSKPSFYHPSSKTKLFMCIIHINRSCLSKNWYNFSLAIWKEYQNLIIGLLIMNI